MLLAALLPSDRAVWGTTNPRDSLSVMPGGYPDTPEEVVVGLTDDITIS